MFRAITVAIFWLTATLAIGQTIKDIRGEDVQGAPGLGREGEVPPTRIPEIPAGADPMERQPDPAADSPAAKAPPQPARGGRDVDCHVRRADTDTGFVVVCEENG